MNLECIPIDGCLYIIKDKQLIDVSWIMSWDRYHVNMYAQYLKRKMRYKLNNINLN